MIRLVRAPNLWIGSHWRNLLEAEGIACQLHNFYSLGAAGELPPDQCGPELWLMDARDRARAEAVIAQAQRPAARGPRWRCASCGEWLEPQFDRCWQCGAAAPDRN
ncbi:hypothetical protein PTE30175_03688 [Pandoraea terrae]|uniref:DUF2007 domain-containing protein n=1 Tax=Pandoraea terrae TaxID=1537710 RepID=A0A5E4XB17_9BURK|nr:DUF2007 domain-containing protein [Pandoraea terrae]VVE33601.1 hypothetical protein PTE30175_03688 [Pandoraea terrae]